MKNGRNIWVSLAFVLLASLILVGCGGSKASTQDDPYSTAAQDDYDEIERLLGITPEDKENSSSSDTESGEDEDLLDILQIDQDDNSQGDFVDSGSEPAVESNALDNLQDDVTDAADQARENEEKMADLRAQTMIEEDEVPAVTSSRDLNPDPDPVYTPPVATGSIGSDFEYEQRYQDGFNLFQQRQYRDAISVFESLLASKTTHSLSDNAQYWIGEAQYALGDYRAAILAFEKVFTFSQSNKNDYAQFKLGQCYYHLRENERALQEFQSLLDNHKESDLISKAQQYMAKL